MRLALWACATQCLTAMTKGLFTGNKGNSSSGCPQAGNELKESASIAEELINRALLKDPKNPLALHLHIHIAEASSPQRWAT